MFYNGKFQACDYGYNIIKHLFCIIFFYSNWIIKKKKNHFGGDIKELNISLTCYKYIRVLKPNIFAKGFFSIFSSTYIVFLAWKIFIYIIYLGIFYEILRNFILNQCIMRYLQMHKYKKQNLNNLLSKYFQKTAGFV